MQHKSKFYKNGGPKEDRGFCVCCESLKLNKIGLLNLWLVLVLVLQLLEAGKPFTTSHGGLVHL